MADDQKHTLELIASHLITAAQPLIDAASSRGAFMRLMARIGFFASATFPRPYQQLAHDASAMRRLRSRTFPTALASGSAALLEKAKAIYDAIQALGCGARAERRRCRGLRRRKSASACSSCCSPTISPPSSRAPTTCLSMLRVITIESNRRDADASLTTCARTFAGRSCRKVVSDPSGLPARVYGWGQPDFDDDCCCSTSPPWAWRSAFPSRSRAATARPDAGIIGMTHAFPPPSGRSLVLPFFYAQRRRRRRSRARWRCSDCPGRAPRLPGSDSRAAAAVGVAARHSHLAPSAQAHVARRHEPRRAVRHHADAAGRRQRSLSARARHAAARGRHRRRRHVRA